MEVELGEQKKGEWSRHLSPGGEALTSHLHSLIFSAYPSSFLLLHSTICLSLRFPSTHPLILLFSASIRCLM